MRNKSWLRYGLGSCVVAGVALSGLLIACESDDDVVVQPDAGTPDTGSPDTGTPDTGTADTGAPLPNAKITVVNAATDLGPNALILGNNAMRICFAISPDEVQFGVTGIPPQPEEPRMVGGQPAPGGIYLGTGGALPSFGVPLSTVAVKPYLMNAASMFARGYYKGGASEATVCDEMVGNRADAGLGLTAGVDYWELPAIPKGAFANGKSYVLVLTGCAADTEIGDDDVTKKAKCGSDFTPSDAPGVGNLKATVYEVDRTTTIPGTKIGAQFIHAATAADPVLATAAGGNRLPVVPGIAQPDGGNYRTITPDGGAVALGEGTALAQLDGVDVANDLLAPNPFVFGTELEGTALPLGTVQLLSFGTPTPAADQTYRQGASFVFIAVGDPMADPAVFPDGGGGFNTRTFHYLGFPTDPTIKIYGQ